MNQHIKIALLGGSGRTGQYLINQLLEKGFSIKVLVRNPEAFAIQNPFIEIIRGEAVDPVVVSKLIDGCKAVISTIGQRPNEPLVHEEATKNILNAMAVYGIARYISVAGINIDTPFDKKGPETTVATNYMKTNFPEIQEDRQKAYTLLIHSDIHWTLVRVPFIEFNGKKGNINVNLDDCLGNKIDAGSIASFLIEQLFDHTYFNKAPFIYNS